MTKRYFTRLNELNENRLLHWIDNPYENALVINGPAESGKSYLAQQISSMIYKLFGRRPMIYDNCQIDTISLNELSGNINIIVQLNGHPGIYANVKYIDITVDNQNL